MGGKCYDNNKNNIAKEKAVEILHSISNEGKKYY